MRTRSGDPAILCDIVTAELGRASARKWSITDDGLWCKVTPDTYAIPDQGWKLHVSATMLSAPVVLSRVSRVLAGAGCAFKFPARLDDYWKFLEPHCSRAQAGKFITVYPRDDAESVRLAALLDEVTRGLPGPVILSDRPYRAGGTGWRRSAPALRISRRPGRCRPWWTSSSRAGTSSSSRSACRGSRCNAGRTGTPVRWARPVSATGRRRSCPSSAGWSGC
ncbi:hypothetical protein ACFV0L_35680 [Streptosporangium canum]|uniref:class III lanthionine synthetase LanKC N-terminal domain-containing protein n=1 Tax=Streptosporangium canum TaxID=324952 RepID=UPI0036C7ECC9